MGKPKHTPPWLTIPDLLNSSRQKSNNAENESDESGRPVNKPTMLKTF
jgi:hypothetical protein